MVNRGPRLRDDRDVIPYPQSVAFGETCPVMGRVAVLYCGFLQVLEQLAGITSPRPRLPGCPTANWLAAIPITAAVTVPVFQNLLSLVAVNAPLTPRFWVFDKALQLIMRRRRYIRIPPTFQVQWLDCREVVAKVLLMASKNKKTEGQGYKE